MKNLLYLSFLFLGVFAFGQPVYKVTEGELQFISKKEGVVLKKDNKYYTLAIDANFDFDENISLEIKPLLDEIPLSEFNKCIEEENRENIVFANEIIPYNFEKIDKYKFVSVNEYDQETKFSLYKFNKDLYYLNGNYSPYIILDFGEGKKAIQFTEKLREFLIPTKKEVKVFMNHSDGFKKFKKYKRKKPKAIDIYSGYFSGVHRFYDTDTLKDKSVYIKNVYGDNALNNSFDSIYFNRHFIVGYKKGNISMYNYKFDKLPLSNLRAVTLEKYFPFAQIIQKNKLRKINLLGKDYKRNDGPSFIDLSFQFPDATIGLLIKKEHDNFYLESDDVWRLVRAEIPEDLYLDYYSKDNRKLYHTEQYDSIRYGHDDFFQNITLYTESGYDKKFPFLLYCKRKDGKFDFNTLEYLLLENPTDEILEINNSLPKNIDNVTVIDQDTYLVEKNNMFTYYPIQKEFRYKKLEDFKGNFARFTLPNGQKGWLDINGNEYLDE